MRIRWATVLLCMLVPLMAGAAETQDIDQLLALDLNRLAEVKLSLGSRIEERAFTSAAAVYVLERDDIVRSGYRHLADVLRLLPGVDVGKGDGSKFSVAVRNGLSRFGTATLAMIDGRHVYTPLNGGVRWESQDIPLDDIERIELVRGPGGPLWGANSVDGIIHIITRRAADTVGARVEAAAGTGEVTRDLQARYGQASADGLAWRLSARHLDAGANSYLPADRSTHAGQRVAGERAHDDGRSDHVDLRADWDGAADTLSLLAGAMDVRYDEERAPLGAAAAVTPYVVAQDGSFATLDWQRRLGADESLRTRLSVEHLDFDSTTLRERHTLVDLDAQHSMRLGRQQLTWGLGWRHYRSRVTLPPTSVCGLCFAFDPLVDRNRTLSAFAQTQWQARDNLTLTLGSKFERSGYAGFQVQPAVRASWQPDADQTLWAAWTRPVRTPTRFDRGAAYFNAPPALAPRLNCRPAADGACLVGNGDDATTWHVRSTELGYRARLGRDTDIDLALFDTRYRLGLSIDAQDRRSRSQVQGTELVLRHAIGAAARVEAGYAWRIGTDTFDDGSTRPVGHLARHTLKLRWSWEPSERWDLSANSQSRTASPSYVPTLASRTEGSTRLNLRAAYRPTRATEVALAGLNLAGGNDSEYIDGFKVNTAPRRGVLLSVSHRY